MNSRGIGGGDRGGIGGGRGKDGDYVGIGLMVEILKNYNENFFKNENVCNSGRRKSN